MLLARMLVREVGLAVKGKVERPRLPGHCKHHNGGWSVSAYSPQAPGATHRQIQGLLYLADGPTRGLRRVLACQGQ